MSQEILTLPEWASAEGVKHIFGITSGTANKLADNGKIISAYFKTRDDARKGVRLFNIQSIRELLASHILN